MLAAGFVLALGMISACGTKPIDPRSVVPADALVFIEANDLGKTIGAITESEAFARVSSKKPDLSSLHGVRAAVAVTGFETTESEITEENSVLNFRPRFVVVAETNAWSWQTRNFVENKLGEFINDIYGGEVELEVTPRQDGKYYAWTSQDGRKAFALQQGSVIYFGNDESAIEKCQAVKRGEAESIVKALPAASEDSGRLAMGHVSTDGVAQLSNIAGITLAMSASEEGEVKSFVSRVLPEILRNSVRTLTWEAVQTEGGIEDRYFAEFDPEVSSAAFETLGEGSGNGNDLLAFVPAEFSSVTLYRLNDPRIAWRSVVLTARSRTDEVSGELIGTFAGSLFEPYAIDDPERFLAEVKGNILTLKLDSDADDDAAVIAKVGNVQEVKQSLAKELNFNQPPQAVGEASIWQSSDQEFAAALWGDMLVAGSANVVFKCVSARQSGANAAAPLLQKLPTTGGTSVTVAKVRESAEKIASVLGERRENKEVGGGPTAITATSFDKKGMRRVTLSDFGLIGSIIERLEGE